ncbi:MAG: DUF2922 domain-containing protein [Synergistaceae bacterium]|nr:DUF2922 domain-containing protein [Synergistaceae bacterium]MBQ3448964.1 DUF2922 domain-containing protein [Synergistaceae bacterium]MBQ9629134.1 DUF2922 domain-containing protein [Synergistaceae bacterium]MBR0251246.1 DUF2922 domain-containing protein [Synergistaceae bacterium]
MSAGTKLVLSFENAAGNTVNYSYNYGDADATSAAVRNAMNTMITNGAIFKNVPVSIKGAKAVVTTETEFNLSE